MKRSSVGSSVPSVACRMKRCACRGDVAPLAPFLRRAPDQVQSSLPSCATDCLRTPEAHSNARCKPISRHSRSPALQMLSFGPKGDQRLAQACCNSVRTPGARLPAGARRVMQRQRAGSATAAAAQQQPRTVQGLSEIAGEFDGVLLDQFGVLHDGRTPYSRAIEAVRQLHAAGKQIVIVSNSSRRSGGTIAKLEKMGFDGAWFAGALAVSLRLGMCSFAAVRRCVSLAVAAYWRCCCGQSNKLQTPPPTLHRHTHTHTHAHAHSNRRRHHQRRARAPLPAAAP